MSSGMETQFREGSNEALSPMGIESWELGRVRVCWFRFLPRWQRTSMRVKSRVATKKLAMAARIPRAM